MNTLKTIITTTILLFLTSTQEVQGQTKEETIAWIKEKLEKYGGFIDNSLESYYSDVQVNPCMISFMEKYNYTDGSVPSRFNPSSVKSWVVDGDRGYIKADANVISKIFSDDNKASMQSGLFLRNGESEIHERMIKALLHLATFCDEGKNEAF